MANYDSVLTGLQIDSSTAAIKNAVGGYSGSGAAQTANDFSIDNLKLDGNTLSSTDTDGHINLTPNGAGDVVIGNIQIDGNQIASSSGNINMAPAGDGIVHGSSIAFCHNYNDAPNTDENYLPWTDATESATAGGRKGYLCMFDMVLKKIIWRTGSANAHTMTIRVESCADGNPLTAGNIVTVATATQAHDGTDHKVYASVASDFDSTPIVLVKDMAVITFQADVDPGGSDWYISTLWQTAE